MYKPPFHRRILPWIFTVVFFAAAPALVFYTAGYRWNAKKEKVERNGTLIIDSKPTGASIFLNGEDTVETTPITLQNASPGRYLIRIAKDGYHPWEKRLDVQPEYVTFANDVWLWKISAPAIASIGAVDTLEASPNENFIAIVHADGTNTTTLGIWDPETGLRTDVRIAGRLHPGFQVIWSGDSRSILVEDSGSTGTNAWLVNVRGNPGPLPLPIGRYRWNGSQLEGTSDNAEISIRTTDGTVVRTPLPAGVKDRFADFIIRHATGTENLVLFQSNNLTRGLILPPGDWRVATTNDKHLILRDGTEWLSVDPNASAPNVHRVQGDHLRPYTEKRKTSYLLVSGGEVWLWNPSADPELLLRQSQRVAEALWHAGGRNIALAAENKVSMLNLDSRDGRMNTILGEFESVTDIALFKKTIYIAGTKDGQTNVWSHVIE